MSLDGYFHLWKAEYTLSKVLFCLLELNFKNSKQLRLFTILNFPQIFEEQQCL